MILLGLSIPTFLRSIPERCILEALLRRVLYCGHSTQYSHLVTFDVSRRRREMYCGHMRLCVCLSAAAYPCYCTDPEVTRGSGRGCPLVVRYWANLQSVHGLRCYDNITRTRNVIEYMTRSMPSLSV